MNTLHTPHNVLHIETVHCALGHILMCTIRGNICVEDIPKIPKRIITQDPQRVSPLYDLLCTPGTKDVYGVFSSSDEAIEYAHKLRWYGAEFTLVCTTGPLLEPEDKALEEVRGMLLDLSH